MLQNWLQPIQLTEIESLRNQAETLGSHLQLFQRTLPSLDPGSVALIGLNEAEGNLVRRSLYSLCNGFPQIQIADLGTLRKRDTSFMIPVMKELLEGGVFPLFIGQDPDFAWAQYQAHLGLQPSVSLAIIDDRLPSLRLLEEPSEKLFHLSLLAGQSHFIPAAVFKQLERRHFDLLRLGSLKKDIAAAEPLLRDADSLVFHLSALKMAEAPAVDQASPSGLFSEQACQLARYAGMSDKLRSAGFYGLRADLNDGNQTAQVVAQMIWYFLEGFASRKNDFPKSKDGLLEYIVDFKDRELQLTFWKSSKSGRWWMQVPVSAEAALQRHRLIPCSYQDYLQACGEEVPERLLNAFKRFE